MDSINSNNAKYILLTIDVEDWFQVENFKPWIPFETWDQRELRIERNVHRLLDLFDTVQVAGKKASLEAGKLGGWKAKITQKWGPMSSRDMDNGLRPKSHGRSEAANGKLTTDKGLKTQANGQLTTVNGHTKKVRCTFFVLGWIAKRVPHLVREIQSRGHEVASHGINHTLSNKLLINDLKIELNDSKKLIEDILGSSIYGFRAPSFSINENVLKAAEDAGYLYSSSYNSFNLHERYGRIDLSANGRKGVALKISDTFFELPLSNLKLMGKIIPWGGGGYFRLTPYAIFRRGVQEIIKRDRAYVFYMHPWEIDPEQPRVNQANFKYKFRHYTNLHKTQERLKHMIADFGIYHFDTCSEYLNTNIRESLG